jgi:hypothetical protein
MTRITKDDHFFMCAPNAKEVMAKKKEMKKRISEISADTLSFKSFKLRHDLAEILSCFCFVMCGCYLSSSLDISSKNAN